MNSDDLPEQEEFFGVIFDPILQGIPAARWRCFPKPGPALPRHPSKRMRAGDSTESSVARVHHAL